MKTIVVYPNNSVEVDGVEVRWAKKDFDRYGINLVRIRKLIIQGGQADTSETGGVKLLVFPTREVVECEVRANADPTQMSVRLRREMLKAAGKPPVIDGPKRGRRSTRLFDVRNGVLHLQCTSKLGSHEDLLPEGSFHHAQGMAHGRMGPCKECWKRYLEARSKK